MTSYGGIIRIRLRVEVGSLPLSLPIQAPLYLFRLLLYIRRVQKASLFRRRQVSVDLAAAAYFDHGFDLVAEGQNIQRASEHIPGPEHDHQGLDPHGRILLSVGAAEDILLGDHADGILIAKARIACADDGHIEGVIPHPKPGLLAEQLPKTLSDCGIAGAGHIRLFKMGGNEEQVVEFSVPGDHAEPVTNGGVLVISCRHPPGLLADGLGDGFSIPGIGGKLVMQAAGYSAAGSSGEELIVDGHQDSAVLLLHNIAKADFDDPVSMEFALKRQGFPNKIKKQHNNRTANEQPEQADFDFRFREVFMQIHQRQKCTHAAHQLHQHCPNHLFQEISPFLPYQ